MSDSRPAGSSSQNAEDDEGPEVPNIPPSTQVTSTGQQNEQGASNNGDMPNIPPTQNVTTADDNDDGEQSQATPPGGEKDKKKSKEKGKGRLRDKVKKVGYKTNRAARLRKEKAQKDKTPEDEEEESMDLYEVTSRARKAKREKTEPWMKDIFSSEGDRLFKKRRWGKHGGRIPTVPPAMLMSGYDNSGYDGDDPPSGDDSSDGDHDDGADSVDIEDDNFIPPDPPDYVTHFELPVERAVYRTVKKNDATINNTKFRKSMYTAWIVTKVYTKVTQSVPYEENREQISEGLKVLDIVTEKPLSQLWNRINRIFPHLLFLFNLAMTLYDLGSSPTLLHFKVSALVLDLVEILFLFSIWFVKKMPFYKKLSDPEKEKFDKKQQYAENLLTELLLYPLIVCSLFGIVVDEAYNFVGWVNIVTMILLAIDIIDLMYTYVIRMLMAWRLLRDIREKIPSITDVKQKFMGNITVRLFVEMIGNTLVFAVMLLMLGAQIHQEQQGRKDYYCSFSTGFMILCTLFLPILSLVLFVVVNYIWVLEMLIKINLYVIQEEAFRDQLQDEYGMLVDGMMNYAVENTMATPSRLRDIELVPLSQRLLYGLREWWILLLVFAWSLLVIFFAVVFDKSANPTLNYVLVGLFIVLLLISNLQVAILALLSNIIMLVILFAVMLYGICDRRKKAKQTKLTAINEEKVANNNEKSKSGELDAVHINMGDYPTKEDRVGSADSVRTASLENLRSISKVSKGNVLRTLNAQTVERQPSRQSNSNNSDTLLNAIEEEEETDKL